MTVSLTVELSDEAYKQLGAALFARNIMGPPPASVIDAFVGRFAEAVKAGEAVLRIKSLRPKPPEAPKKRRRKGA